MVGGCTLLKAWRPGDEAEATSGTAVFVEWLRATGIRPNTSPDDVRDWQALDRTGFHAALVDFMELDRSKSPAALFGAGMSPEILAALRDTAWPEFLDAVAFHLLEANTTPDQSVMWRPGDITALAAVAMGAMPIGTAPTQDNSGRGL
jgi:hypothetical protein